MTFENKYSDLHLTLKQDSSGVILVYGSDALTQSIKTILSTYPGERIMQPDFGSRLRDFLFEPMTFITIERMEIEIRRAIEQWEDRIIINKLNIDSNPDGNYYDITISYRIRTTGQLALFNGRVKPTNA